MLCGYAPFYGDDDAQTMSMVKRGAFAFDSPNWDGVGDEARHLIGRMLTLDPKARPDAKDLLGHPWVTSAEVRLPLRTTSGHSGAGPAGRAR